MTWILRVALKGCSSTFAHWHPELVLAQSVGGIHRHIHIPCAHSLKNNDATVHILE